MVIPNLNKGELLQEALDSFDKQDCQDFELIVVDDGSTNKIDQRILHQLEQRPHTVVMYLTQNHGTPYARSEGERRAQCDIIIRADSDDMSLPTRISRTLAAFDRKPETTLYHSASMVLADYGDHPGLYRYGADGNGPFDLDRLFRTSRFYIDVTTMAYRKSVHPYHRIEYAKSQFVSDDWLHLYTVILGNKYHMVYEAEPVAIYRAEEGDLEKNALDKERLHDKRRRLLQELEAKVRGWKKCEPEAERGPAWQGQGLATLHK